MKKYNASADLIALAKLRYDSGNIRDSLKLVMSAFQLKSMKHLAEALCSYNENTAPNTEVINKKLPKRVLATMEEVLDESDEYFDSMDHDIEDSPLDEMPFNEDDYLEETEDSPEADFELDDDHVDDDYVDDDDDYVDDSESEVMDESENLDSLQESDTFDDTIEDMDGEDDSEMDIQETEEDISPLIDDEIESSLMRKMKNHRKLSSRSSKENDKQKIALANCLSLNGDIYSRSIAKKVLKR